MDSQEFRASRVVRMVFALGALLAACGDDKKVDAPDASTSEDAAAESDSDSSSAASADAPTWHQDIAPLVALKCGACHKEGGIAPFSVRSYEAAKPFAGPMAKAVEDGRMPPFLAQETDECKPKLPWMEDLRLSSDEKALLRAWADAGAPLGDPDSAAEVKLPRAVELEREDVVMTVPKEIVTEGGKDLHTCAIVDPEFEQDEYVVGRLITAGNPKILHHVVSYIIEPGSVEDPPGSGTMRPRTKAELEAAIKKEKGVGIGAMYDCFGGPALTASSTTMLDAWAPGSVPNMSPDDSGQPVSKDSLVLLDMHYHPTGSMEKDSTTKLALMLSKDRPTYVARTILIGNFEEHSEVVGPGGSGGIGDLVKQPDETTAEFLIPAGAKDHVEDMTWEWRLPLGGVRVFAMGTHMHYVGRKMRITLERAMPKESEDANECLIETPSWDFNWQRGYAYDAPYEKLPEMRNGDTLKFHCEFDNTTDNPYVVQALSDQSLDAPVDVRLGEDTLDEMCLGAITIMYPNF